MKQSEQLRFWSKVRIGWPDECWLWQAGTDQDGYGKFQGRTRRTVRAPRYALLAAHGRLDDERQVLHSCDVPGCCNPAHLRLGTNSDNRADMFARGRHARQVGEANAGAKLTDDKVREMRRLLATGVSGAEVAAAYGVAHSVVSEIKHGKAWGHVK